jgi:hypothetical protein
MVEKKPAFGGLKLAERSFPVDIKLQLSDRKTNLGADEFPGLAVGPHLPGNLNVVIRDHELLTSWPNPGSSLSQVSAYRASG